jgi:signal transduction histidine kinase/DNA-binding response OmpR family regulator
MSVLSPRLNQFLTVVPALSQPGTLGAALQAMTTAECDRLVLVDADHRPVGWVGLAPVLQALMQHGQLDLVGQEMTPGTVQAALRSPSLAENDIPAVLRVPVAIAQADLSVTQFLLDAPPQQADGATESALRFETGPDVALVDRDGRYVGLLDRLRVFHFLMQPSSQGRSPLALACAASASGGEPANSALPLEPLLELLKRLPLPLMLQTSGGRVLAQTALWHEQADQLADPQAVRQAAAGLRSPQEAPVGTPTCQLGATANTFTCNCPLKNGQEQVLQFVYIALGTLQYSPPSALSPATARPAAPQPHSIQWWNWIEPQLPSPFQLADLLPNQPLDPEPFLTTTPETLWLVLAQDVTEQQQLARELTAKNADLIQLNRLKDEFLACISHELRTPLTAVLGLSSLLKDQTLGHLNQRQVHYAQLIYQSGRHLMAVVNDILDLTRMETGQLELVPEPVDIRTVCDRAVAQAKQLRILDDKQDTKPNVKPDAKPDAKQLGESGTPSTPEVLLEIDPNLDLLIADELRLRQMLVHLLSNAFKFTETHQQVGLRVNRWGGWIAFTVWDTGLGIPADQQHLIFQKFKQLENPLTRRFEGTGLGLAITQRLARLHGGDVTFISKEGEGSQFTILLPPTPPEKSQRTSSDDDLDGLAADSDELPPGPGAIADRVPLSRQSPTLRPSAKPTPSKATDSLDPLAPATSPNSLHRNPLVLAVESAPQFVEAISDQLTKLGYRVVIARSGTEALEKARRLQPGLIFLNPILPLLSGWDVLTLLKTSAETRQIPVVITSTQADAEQASRSPAERFIPLPIQEKSLRQTLHHLLLAPDGNPAPPANPNKLTILHLNTGAYSSDPLQNQALVEDLNQLLHSKHYRILEADDLEQAELLARVWKPKVILLSGTVASWDLYFQRYNQYTFLASLPLVTLDPAATQAANQIPGLLVFPCLAPLQPQLVDEAHESSALLQVIQVAVGYSWQPSLLVLDFAALPGQDLRQRAPADTLGSLPQESEWLQALTQYLGTAGFRSVIGRSWTDVWQQLETQSADLVLIGWTATTADALTLQRLTLLQTLPTCPPILVLDHRQHDDPSTDPYLDIAPLPPALEAIATQVLPPSISMSDLLGQIHQAIR